ncbi:hypothetical protein QIH96_13055 [Bradyrhizobium japonicum]|uniref:hypothetical protein n=1 Tax=Bradyrhizobium japonicum TaxID=375 RepID=UPI0027147CBA|nr:hypothetical protein [Bradyrhizobium japonicum]WLB66029.1 hypothetical protein QIH96_13055 [Bradyrhizobium japonicum]
MVELQRVEIVFGNTLKITEVAELPLGRQQITLAFGPFVITAEGNHVMYTLPADHSVLMQVAYLDAKGNPATVDGEVSWSSTDPSIVAVTVDTEDSTICRATPVGSIGQAQITASCDADLGDGVRELLTLCDIEVVGGEAVTGTIQPVGEPVPQADHVEHHDKQT